GFPGNKPEKWETAKASIQPVDGRHDVYIYFRKDQHFAQDLLRLDYIFYHKENPRYLALGKRFKENVELLEEIIPQETPILQELDGDKARKTHFFIRGDWRNPGEEVKPGVPASFGKITAEKVDRLSFARWLVSKENPLTAR